MSNCSLAELIIHAASKAWEHDGELLATGITPLPRLAASLAKTMLNPALMITDGECWFAEEPVPPGPRGDRTVRIEGWAPYARTFENLWSGKRHAMVAPVQLDRFGQTNISVIGDHGRPRAQMLGARGFPGNTLHHPNSYFFPVHSRRALVPGEVDFVCSVGYNPARWPDGKMPKKLDLRLIVTNLCVLDFGGPDHAIRLVSLHPGVTLAEAQDNTGFELALPEGSVPVTPLPCADMLAEIARLDPNNIRATILKNNPPAVGENA
jgi:glutaconate CoA-transferase, subunit B